MKKLISRLSEDDRTNIQAGIAKCIGLLRTAIAINKSRSTVYREILNYCYYKNYKKKCINCKNIKCKQYLINPTETCEKFELKECLRWKKFPYTCNGCNKSQYCRRVKRYYNCCEAEINSDKNRSLPRVHKRLSLIEIKQINAIVTNGVSLGQSLHHIYVSNKCLHNICCEKSIRRYLYEGYFTVKAYDLPRYVRYRHHVSYKKINKIIDPARLLNRTFSDYLKYLFDNPNKIVWQYDSVVGKRNDKVAVLTITMPSTRFQFGFLITKGNADSVYKKLRTLQMILGDNYSKIFEVNLADNGTEFSRFYQIEVSEYGEILCKTFYTNVYKATDKPQCEKNHEFIRYIIPKGISLNFMTQEKVNLMFSHINSYIRKSDGDVSPYDLVVKRFGLKFMEAIGIKRIPANKVCLKPWLIR